MLQGKLSERLVCLGSFPNSSCQESQKNAGGLDLPFGSAAHEHLAQYHLVESRGDLMLTEASAIEIGPIRR